jgi:serine/threonine protein kinase
MRTVLAKAESIILIRHIPVTKEAWLQCRFGVSRIFRGFEDCWVEFRDSCMLLYHVTHERAGVTDFKNQDPANIVRSCPLSQIELIPLRDATVSLNAKKQVARVQKSDRTGVFDIKFVDKDIYEEWTNMIRESIGLRRVTLADFQIQRHVGKGASGRVYLVTDRATKEHLALKVIEKTTVLESEESYRHALDERIVLEMAGEHPFILDMKFAFQNRDRLFLVTEFCAGGDLFEYLNSKTKPLEEAKARYVVAEIFLALEYIHSLGVVYRDLKLENVLLDQNGHVRLADFGLSKLLRRDESPTLIRTNTFCGTREYVAPEMLARTPYDTSVDLWAFGILLYEILCGRTPFYSKERDEIYERIQKTPVFYPKELSENVQDLLQGLLQRDASRRLGACGRGLEDVKSHVWFSGVDWNSLPLKQNHKHSIAADVRQLSFKFSSNSSATNEAGKKSKRRIAQEKAMEILLGDAAADSKAVQSSSLTVTSSFAQVQSPGAKSPKVVQVQKTRKRTPIIAGYSFNGKWPDLQLQSMSKAPSLRREVVSNIEPTNLNRCSKEGIALAEEAVPNVSSNISSVQSVMPSDNQIDGVRIPRDHSETKRMSSVDSVQLAVVERYTSAVPVRQEFTATDKETALSLAQPGDLEDIVDTIVATPSSPSPSVGNEYSEESAGIKHRYFTKKKTGQVMVNSNTE